ncbi:hypothetical protein MRX96_047915 [Rhipicephalus microplus]
MVLARRLVHDQLAKLHTAWDGSDTYLEANGHKSIVADAPLQWVRQRHDVQSLQCLLLHFAVIIDRFTVVVVVTAVVHFMTVVVIAVTVVMVFVVINMMVLNSGFLTNAGDGISGERHSNKCIDSLGVV